MEWEDAHQNVEVFHLCFLKENNVMEFKMDVSFVNKRKATYVMPILKVRLLIALQSVEMAYLCLVKHVMMGTSFQTMDAQVTVQSLNKGSNVLLALLLWNVLLSVEMDLLLELKNAMELDVWVIVQDLLLDLLALLQVENLIVTSQPVEIVNYNQENNVI